LAAVYYVVNNLPLAERRKNVVLHGLWCGVGKPNMNCFLQPVVEELVSLHDNGLSWTLSSGQLVKTTVNLDLIVADSVACPLLQNFKQFNGKYGCSYCLHEGELVDKGLGSVRTYPLSLDLPQLRMHDQSLDFAEQAESTGFDVFWYLRCVGTLFIIYVI
jgi:hypothetical protein